MNPGAGGPGDRRGRGFAFGDTEVEPRDSLRAIDNIVRDDELSVVFQPIVGMDQGEAFAYEALVRCSRPGMSPPVLFERAVTAGCCGRLGRAVRELAVPAASGVPLFLNIHPQELHERWLVRPDDPIFLHDHQVYLEITESVPLTHFELCQQVLSELRTRGDVHLVVDDLGAGYSNLQRISDLAPNVVKLDRGLVLGVDLNKRQHRLVTSVVRLCREMDARVVAEGIETEDEFSALRDTGVDYGQGYLFARPHFPFPKISWPPDRARALI